jgi:glycine cleavage system transcriptional repressor
MFRHRNARTTPAQETTMKYGVLTTVSRDRDGLVATYTDHLRQWGANLYMGHGQALGRMFVFDTLFQVDETDLPRLAVGVKEDLGQASPTLVEAPPPVAYRNPNAQHYSLTYLEEDIIGIMSTLAAALTTHGASIVSLESETLPAPTTGVPLFRVQMEVDVPNSLAVRNLREEFATLQRYKGWAIEFESETRAGLRVRATAPYPPSAGQRWAPAPPPPGEAPFANASQWAVLSTISTDRPGIIASSSRFLAQRRANIHSQAARRVGELFSAHYLLRATEADLQQIQRDYRKELADFAPRLVEAARPAHPADALHLELTVHAIDEPGILAGLCRPITNHGASIASVSFGVYPGTGTNANSTPLFVVEMSLLVRDYIASRHIEAELLTLERNRGWEIDYRPLRKPVDSGGAKHDA